ncbi:MAG: bZIP transcription factor [Clostridiales bacterium]|nr:bZIP transcription factor [Clostridiales bacterium]
MKKLLTVLALTLMTVVMAIAVIGCGTTDTTAIDELTKRIEALEKENEDLKKKDNELQNQVNNLNVFWADKKEYAETDTMTIYFRDTAVYKIRLRFDTLNGTPFSSGGYYLINAYFYLTGLCSDIQTGEVVFGTFLESDKGDYLRSTDFTELAKQGVETSTGSNYTSKNIENTSITRLDFVVCVPGTKVELARFKNVSFNFN